MAQIDRPSTPDTFAFPPGFTPSVQSPPPDLAPYYGFARPQPPPSISTYQPTLGTQLTEQLYRTLTGNFPGAEAVPQAGTTLFPHYSKLEQVLAAKMPKQAPAQQVRGIVQSGGVKPEEVEYSGVEQYLQQYPLASKEGLTQHIQQTRPKLNVEQLRDVSQDDLGRYSYLKDNTYILDDAQKAELKQLEQQYEGGPTKFSQYTLPGGERYRELLVTVPERPEKLAGTSMKGEPVYKYGEGPSFTSSHFDEPNVLAHLRVNDRVTPDGKKVLFIEEVQSDWHQKGRQRGYNTPANAAGVSDRLMAKLPRGSVIREDGKTFHPSQSSRQVLKLSDYLSEDEITQLSKAHDDIAAGGPMTVEHGVPDAPYKKSWPLLAMKQALADAAKDGKDYVAWTTGAQQAERYDLSKQLSKIEYEKADGGRRISIGAFTPDGHEAISRQVSAEELPNLVGKDVADRILSSKQSSGELSGLDLKVGGEGMSSFYDKELVNELNKYAKQWGVKVEQLPLKFGNDLTAPSKYRGPDLSYNQLLDMSDKVREAGSQLNSQYREVLRDVQSGTPFMRAIELRGSPALAELLGGKFDDLPKKGGVVHAIPITPRMREEILGKGQPLFQLGAGLAGGTLAAKLVQPREQTLEQREKGYHLTRLGREQP